MCCVKIYQRMGSTLIMIAGQGEERTLLDQILVNK